MSRSTEKYHVLSPPHHGGGWGSSWNCFLRNCMKSSDLHRKIMFGRQYSQGGRDWGKVYFPNKIFARKWIKLPDLHRKVTFPKPQPLQGGGQLKKHTFARSWVKYPDVYRNALFAYSSSKRNFCQVLHKMFRSTQ